MCGGARELLVRLGDIGVGVCLVLDGGANSARVLRVLGVVFLVVLPVRPVRFVVLILERLVVVESVGDGLSGRSCLVGARRLAARLQTVESTESPKPTKGKKGTATPAKKRAKKDVDDDEDDEDEGRSIAKKTKPSPVKKVMVKAEDSDEE